ncbi:MAG: hypothetical protein JRJ23_07490, partial [Deltaproteobacteria bacterium]|nr:hypothetical protein [Deltaproteobacteria bacterium]
MLNIDLRRFSFSLIIGFIAVFLTGCATTKPNIPYQGPYPPIYHALSIKNPLFAEELGKIPEIQDGISKAEADTLALMADIYLKDTEKFDSMFNQMYSIGKPEVRKYNSALQAFYWLLEDNAIEKANIVLNNYQLTKLLDYSWVLGNTEHIFYWQWKTKEARLLYQSCSDPSLIDKIDKFEKENKGSTGYIIELAKEYPEKFEYKYDETTYDEFRSKTKKRWEQFDTVVERLNAPELI